MAEQVIRWVTPIDPKRLKDKAFKALLRAIAADPCDNGYLPFARLPMVHFASIIIFDKASPPLLVFESNIDASWKEYVTQLVCVGRQALDCIYEGTRGYPPRGSPASSVRRFFHGLKRKTQLYHIGHPNRTVQEIRGDHELRRSIAYVLDHDSDLRQLPPREIMREIHARAKCPRLWFWERRRAWNDAWNGPPPDPPTALDQITWEADTWSWPKWFFRTLELLAIALATAIALVVLLNPWISTNALIFLEVVLLFVLVRVGSGNATILRSAFIALVFGCLVVLACKTLPWFSQPLVNFVPAPRKWAAAILVLPGLLTLSFLHLVWLLMTSDPIPVPPEVKKKVPVLLEAEDRPINSHYNHVAGLSELKPGLFLWLRFVRTWLALELLNLFYRTEYVKGKLVTIPSIHFAQWSLVNRRYLLFVTNYDGPAESYLDDFFRTLALGVAFMWQNTVIFPMSIDPSRLKMWVRQGQTLASVRYRAAVYDGLTVAAINNNKYIRKRLLKRPSAAGAQRWLRRFVTTPEEPTVFTRVTGWVKQAVEGVRG